MPLDFPTRVNGRVGDMLAFGMTRDAECAALYTIRSTFVFMLHTACSKDPCFYCEPHSTANTLRPMPPMKLCERACWYFKLDETVVSTQKVPGLCMRRHTKWECAEQTTGCGNGYDDGLDADCVVTMAVWRLSDQLRRLCARVFPLALQLAPAQQITLDLQTYCIRTTRAAKRVHCAGIRVQESMRIDFRDLMRIDACNMRTSHTMCNTVAAAHNLVLRRWSQSHAMCRKCKSRRLREHDLRSTSS